jgi:hypothetical protein
MGSPVSSISAVDFTLTGGREASTSLPSGRGSGQDDSFRRELQPATTKTSKNTIRHFNLMKNLPNERQADTALPERR